MKRPACVTGCLILLTLWIICCLRPPEPYSDGSISEKTQKICGTVCDKYQKNGSTYLLVKNAGSISGNKSEKKHKVKVKLKDGVPSLKSAPSIGSTVTLTGKGMLFPRARNPGNFDLALYEKIHGNDYEIYDTEVCKIREGHGFCIIDERLCLLREKLSDVTDSIYKEEDAGVIKAMLLGDRGSLSEEIRSCYQRAGMSHILCISALHITLLGMGVLKLLKRTGLKRGTVYAISFAFIVLYGRFTGSGVSTIRALITFGLMMTADIAGRTPDILSSMSIAGSVIMLAKPLYVLDAGFILSFTAVSGIGILLPSVNKLFPVRGGLFESLEASAAVTVFMLPATMYFFFKVPLYSILVNLAVIPLLGFLLVSAVCSLGLGTFSYPTAMIAGIPAKLILRLYGYLTDLNDRLPFSMLTPGREELWQAGVYYLLLAAAVYLSGRLLRGRRRWSVGRIRLLFFGILVFAVLILSVRIRPPFCHTTLDVGQGDCHFLEIRDCGTVMIDCGSSDVKNVARYRVTPYVLSRGYDRIDHLFISHSDMDHISGVIEILEEGENTGLSIGSLILPDIEERDENYEKLINIAKSRGIKIMKIREGDRFSIGKADFHCLNPVKDRKYSDINAASVCLFMSIRGSHFSALYTGDVQEEGEEELIKGMKRLIENGSFSGKLSLLKCAHHGSKNSTPEELVSILSPGICFISAGVGNRYGHPHRELLDRLTEAGCRSLITSERGALRMDVMKEKVRINCYLD